MLKPMQNQYRKTSRGLKAYVDNKYVCKQCGMQIEERNPSPYCYFCEDYIAKNIKELFNDGWTVGLLSQKFKLGYIKVRDILGLKKGEGCADKSPGKVVPTSNLKIYKDYIKVEQVKDSLSFLKSKIKN